MSSKVIVMFKENTPAAKIEDAVKQIESNGGTVGHRYTSTILGFAATIPDNVLTTFQSNDLIESIEADGEVSIYAKSKAKQKLLQNLTTMPFHIRLPRPSPASGSPSPSWSSAADALLEPFRRLFTAHVATRLTTSALGPAYLSTTLHDGAVLAARALLSRPDDAHRSGATTMLASSLAGRAPAVLGRVFDSRVRSHSVTFGPRARMLRDGDALRILAMGCGWARCEIVRGAAATARAHLVTHHHVGWVVGVGQTVEECDMDGFRVGVEVAIDAEVDGGRSEVLVRLEGGHVLGNEGEVMTEGFWRAVDLNGMVRRNMLFEYARREANVTFV
ncbi:hypothetical protein HK101_000631 [Irineochytrium annulatum]|nr:hypothetical protein HK101_000631 [Irineochytrium annulatum]